MPKFLVGSVALVIAMLPAIAKQQAFSGYVEDAREARKQKRSGGQIAIQWEIIRREIFNDSTDPPNGTLKSRYPVARRYLFSQSNVRCQASLAAASS
jgi:hypothetical protein